MNNEQCIELDCEPFSARPSTYLPAVLKETNIPIQEATSKMFGSWVFEYNNISKEEWQIALPTIKKNIRSLYHSGCIRYGSPA